MSEDIRNKKTEKTFQEAVTVAMEYIKNKHPELATKELQSLLKQKFDEAYEIVSEIYEVKDI